MAGGGRTETAAVLAIAFLWPDGTIWVVALLLLDLNLLYMVDIPSQHYVPR